MDYAASVYSRGSIYAVAKFLLGRKPKSVTTFDNSVKVENNKGDVTIIDNRAFNIYSNNKAIQFNCTII